MIVQSTRIARKTGYQNLERHLLDKHDDNERIKILVGDRAIFADSQALADAKGCKYSLRHLSISPDTEMSPSQLADFARSIDAEFGIGTQRPLLVVLHEKRGRTHFHLAVAEVDPVTNRVLGSQHDYARLERLARDYEAANGEQVQISRAERARERIEGFSSKARHKAERISSSFDLTRLKLACAEGAAELRVELQRQALSVEQGVKGFILVSSDGQFVAAAHRATGLRKNEFKTFWETYSHGITRPHTDAFAAGDSSHFKGGSLDRGKRNGRHQQSQLAPDLHPATSKTTDRPSAGPFRPSRTHYSTLVHYRAQRTLLVQSLNVIDWDELARLAEELTSALMTLVRGPRALLTARIHHARSAAVPPGQGNQSTGPIPRPQ